jgi:putative DNA primase/helicase
MSDDTNIIQLSELQRNSRTIRVIAGELPRLVDEAEQALVDHGLPIFKRGDTLMHPVRELVPASNGRMTITAKLKVVTTDLLLRWLAEAATYVRYDARKKDWVDIHHASWRPRSWRARTGGHFRGLPA